jgi:hypothetical protein
MIWKKYKLIKINDSSQTYFGIINQYKTASIITNETLAQINKYHKYFSYSSAYLFGHYLMHGVTLYFKN